jgi:hypothetical protein
MKRTTEVVDSKEERHHITNLLVQYLRDSHANDAIATYEDMRSVTHEDIPHKYRHLLTTALRVVKRDYQIHFDCVSTVGYKPKHGEAAMIMIGSRSQRRVKAEVKRWRENFDLVPKDSFRTQQELSTWLTEEARLRMRELQEASSDVRLKAVVDAVKPDVLDAKNMRKLIKASHDALIGLG